MDSGSISRFPVASLPSSASRRLAAVGRDPINLHRSLAHAPALLAPLLDLIHALRFDAEVSRSLRELMICRIAQLEDSAYELAHHLPMAAASGLDTDQVEAIARWRDADCFSAPQRAVLGYAEHLGAGAPRDDEALNACFTPKEQTELTVTGATYLAIARMLRALDVRTDEGLSALFTALSGSFPLLSGNARIAVIRDVRGYCVLGFPDAWYRRTVAYGE